MSALAFLKSFMITRDHCACVCTAGNVNCSCIVSYMFTTLYKLRRLHLEAEISKLSVMPEDIRRKVVCKTHFAGKRAELFHREYAVFD